MKLSFYRIELPLEHVFTIARGSRSSQTSLIVELEHQGQRGYGEATEHPYYGVEFDSMASSLEACRPTVESYDGDSPSRLWDRLQPTLSREMFLLAAIDSAAHDLFGKLAKRTTFEALGLQWDEVPRSSFTIGIDSIDLMVEKLVARSGWPIFKIKLGTDHDVQIVEQLRQHTSAIFRVDANCGWTPAETIENSRALRDLNVEFIEQPLSAAAAADDHERVYRESALPIVADESCLVESDVHSCFEKFHGINVKLSKCGGITPAFRMLQHAKELGMQTMIGCMVESSVGISAAAQLVPLLDYADLDGSELLVGDIAEGVRVVDGSINLSGGHGNGILRLIQRGAAHD